MWSWWRNINSNNHHILFIYLFYKKEQHGNVVSAPILKTDLLFSAEKEKSAIWYECMRSKFKKHTNMVIMDWKMVLYRFNPVSNLNIYTCLTAKWQSSDPTMRKWEDCIFTGHSHTFVLNNLFRIAQTLFPSQVITDPCFFAFACSCN